MINPPKLLYIVTSDISTSQICDDKKHETLPPVPDTRCEDDDSYDNGCGASTEGSTSRPSETTTTDNLQKSSDKMSLADFFDFTTSFDLAANKKSLEAYLKLTRQEKLQTKSAKFSFKIRVVHGL